ncbi:DsbA family oxidoreductase [Nonomuraea mangrovi]|uniref:DsbA family oxidoreductase n=1 Tax=Nonomuraea mangrovi TaxID=2316207 RepID=A0ABW4T8Q5_9ACTN
MTSSTRNDTMTIEVYADIVCPWCYIGKRRLERALRNFRGTDGVRIVYRPFQLDPGAPATGTPARRHLGQKLGSQVGTVLERTSRMAAREGIEMHFDHALIGNTLDAHRVLRLAEAEGKQAGVLEQLFAAYFTHGRDITDHAVLADAAAAAGLDRRHVLDMLAGSTGVREVTAEIAAAHARGVSSVPTIVVNGRHAIQGVQEIPALLDALERARDEAGAGDAETGDTTPNPAGVAGTCTI